MHGNKRKRAYRLVFSPGISCAIEAPNTVAGDSCHAHERVGVYLILVPDHRRNIEETRV